MAEEQWNLSSLPLHQLVGAPLLSLVQGESLAARATLDFLTQLGFVPPADQVEGDPIEETTSAPVALGSLRMVTFAYQKPLGGGATSTCTVQVPLLSLVNIPVVKIKSAELEFGIKLTGARRASLWAAGSEDEARLAPYLSPSQLELTGQMGSLPVSSKAHRSGKAQLRVKLQVEQAPLPPGILELLRITEQNITATSSENDSE